MLNGNYTLMEKINSSIEKIDNLGKMNERLNQSITIERESDLEQKRGLLIDSIYPKVAEIAKIIQDSIAKLHHERNSLDDKYNELLNEDFNEEIKEKEEKTEKLKLMRNLMKKLNERETQLDEMQEKEERVIKKLAEIEQLKEEKLSLQRQLSSIVDYKEQELWDFSQVTLDEASLIEKNKAFLDKPMKKLDKLFAFNRVCEKMIEDLQKQSGRLGKDGNNQQRIQSLLTLFYPNLLGMTMAKIVEGSTTQLDETKMAQAYDTLEALGLSL